MYCVAVVKKYVKGISKPLSELGVKVIDKIEYYNTKYMPVNNDNIKEKTIVKYCGEGEMNEVKKNNVYSNFDYINSIKSAYY